MVEGERSRRQRKLFVLPAEKPDVDKEADCFPDLYGVAYLILELFAMDPLGMAIKGEGKYGALQALSVLRRTGLMHRKA